MRAYTGVVVMLLGVVACGGGRPPAGTPAPQGFRAPFQFAKGTHRVRYEVHEKTRQTILDRVTLTTDRTLYVTEQFEDSLEAHLIHVRIDSGMGRPGSSMSLGPFPGFKAWFNDRRDRLDTLASDISVELYRATVFNGTVPLPPDTVGVGDVWNAGATTRRTIFRIPEAPLRGGTHGVVKSLSVINGDTVAVLALTIEIHGTIKPKSGGNDIDVHGEEKGEESFSVSRGISLNLDLKGSIEWDTDVMTPGGLNRVSTILHNEYQRRLLEPITFVR